MQCCSGATFLSDANNVDRDAGESIVPIDLATFVIGISIVVDRNVYRSTVEA